MKKIIIYTDGSCLGNPGPGGWAAIIIDGNNIKKISGNKKSTTNNQMELQAAIEALKKIKQPSLIEIYSDSNYLVKGMNEWIENWIKKDFKGVKNSNLWKEILDLTKKHKVTFNWIKAHNGNKYNEECDKIARENALKAKSANN